MCANRTSGARWGRQAQTMERPGSMVDQMKTGPSVQVMSVRLVNSSTAEMRAILAMQALEGMVVSGMSFG